MFEEGNPVFNFVADLVVHVTTIEKLKEQIQNLSDQERLKTFDIMLENDWLEISSKWIASCIEESKHKKGRVNDWEK